MRLSILARRAIRRLPFAMNARFIGRRLKRSDGAEIAEAALVLPVVFILLFGIIWFGRAFNIYSTIQQAAQQGALVAARSPCATCTQLDSTATVANVDAAITAVMRASSLDITQINSPTSAPSCGGGTACAGCATSTHNAYVCLNATLTGTAPAQNVAVVSFRYPFQFNLPGTSLNMRNIFLYAQAQSRMEN
jgi:Flp pilus assembly protein TadG